MVAASNAVVEFFRVFSHSKNLRGFIPFKGFYVQISLNFLKTFLFIPHTCSAFVKHALVENKPFTKFFCLFYVY